ncbi:MAG: helicase-related protein [Candidatus Paceibacteria bacterium]
MTPKIFLGKLASGRVTNEEVGGVIIDELHEGTKEYHMIMGLLKLMHERGEAPLTLLTSATMNEEQIIDFYDMDEGHYMEVEGRTYPVDTHPLDKDGKKLRNSGSYGDKYTLVAAEKAKEVVSEQEGDILVFMPGRASIDDTKKKIEEKLRNNSISGVEVLPVSGSHPGENKHLARTGKGKEDVHTRIIVSTDMAESSLTIPEITAVIDSCKNKRPDYDSEKGIESLKEQKITKDNVDQRKGRAGRIQQGDYYPMLTENELDNLREHPTPEIQRGNLENVVLNLKRILKNWDDIEFEEFVKNYLPEPPKWSKVKSTVEKLKSLRALDQNGKITPEGEEMEQLPFDARISKIIIEARKKENGEDLEKTSLVLGALSRLRGDLTFYSEEGDAHQDHKRAGFYSLGGDSSDWIKDLNIIRKAINEAQADEYIKKSNDHSLQQRLFNWCKNRSIHFNSLKDVLVDLQEKYARHADMRIDLSDLGDEIERVLRHNQDELSEVLLSGYPDSLIHRGRYGLKQLESGTSISGIDKNSSSSQTGKKPKLAIASKIFQPYSNKYAGGVHPVDAKHLQKVLPEKVERNTKHTRLDEETGEITANVEYKYDSEKRRRQPTIGKTREKLIGEKLAEHLPELMVEGEISFLDEPQIEHNEQLYERIRDLYIRTGGRIDGELDKRFTRALDLQSGSKKEDLTQIYETIIKTLPSISTELDRLDDVESIHQLEDIIDNLDTNPFKLQAEWFLDSERTLSELEQEVDHEAPKSLNINGVEVDIEYEYDPHYQEYSAIINIPKEELFSLSTDDFEDLELGFQDMKPEISFSSQVALKEFSSFSELKKYYLDQKKRKAWKEFEPPREEELDLFGSEELPDRSDLEGPVEYLELSGGKFYAYPTIEYDRYKDEYRIKYIQDEQKAKEKYESAKENRDSEIRETEQEEELQEVKMEYSDQFKDLKDRVQQLKQEYKEKGRNFRMDNRKHSDIKKSASKVEQLLEQSPEETYDLDDYEERLVTNLEKMREAVGEAERVWKGKLERLEEIRSQFEQKQELFSQADLDRGQSKMLKQIKEYLALEKANRKKMNPEKAKAKMERLESKIEKERVEQEGFSLGDALEEEPLAVDRNEEKTAARAESKADIEPDAESEEQEITGGSTNKEQWDAEEAFQELESINKKVKGYLNLINAAFALSKKPSGGDKREKYNEIAGSMYSYKEKMENLSEQIESMSESKLEQSDYNSIKGKFSSDKRKLRSKCEELLYNFKKTNIENEDWIDSYFDFVQLKTREQNQKVEKILLSDDEWGDMLELDSEVLSQIKSYVIDQLNQRPALFAKGEALSEIILKQNEEGRMIDAAMDKATK